MHSAQKHWQTEEPILGPRVVLYVMTEILTGHPGLSFLIESNICRDLQSGPIGVNQWSYLPFTHMPFRGILEG